MSIPLEGYTVEKVRNIFAIDASRYSKNAHDRRSVFEQAKKNI